MPLWNPPPRPPSLADSSTPLRHPQDQSKVEARGEQVAQALSGNPAFEKMAAALKDEPEAVAQLQVCVCARARSRRCERACAQRGRDNR